MSVQAPYRGEPLRASWAANLAAEVNALSPMGSNGMLSRQGLGGTGFAPLPTNRRQIAASAGSNLFAFRFVKPTENDATVPYTGWEIYMPTGSVSVGSTCTPLNPAAYRTVNDETVTLDGWYRMPFPSGTPAALTGWDVVVHAKCSSAQSGIDTFANWPKQYVWAEVRKSVRTQQEREADVNDVGDTFAATVGSIVWRVVEEGEDPVPACSRLVNSPIFVRDTSPSEPFKLLTCFSVSVSGNTVALTLDKLFVRNQEFSAAGATYISDTMAEVSTSAAAIYLKISTMTNPYTATIRSYANLTAGQGLSVPQQAAADRQDGEILVLLYQLASGHVVLNGLSSLQNIQLYQ